MVRVITSVFPPQQHEQAHKNKLVSLKVNFATDLPDCDRGLAGAGNFTLSIICELKLVISRDRSNKPTVRRGFCRNQLSPSAVDLVWLYMFVLR